MFLGLPARMALGVEDQRDPEHQREHERQRHDAQPVVMDRTWHDFHPS
jgi:hypothetical protein